MITKLISIPDPAVSLTEAKGYFRILHSDEDVEITRVIKAAQEKAEQITNRVLVKSTFEVKVDDFKDVVLEKTPFVQVQKIEYVAVDNSTKLVSGYVGSVVLTTDRTTIHFADIPADLKSGKGNVTITYEAGYETVPAQIQSYILAEALTMFENRHLTKVEGEIDAGSKHYYERLLDSYRVIPV